MLSFVHYVLKIIKIALFYLMLILHPNISHFGEKKALILVFLSFLSINL